jgi:hypothetical protein
MSANGTAVHGGNHVTAGAFSFHVAIAVEANGPPVLHRLGEGWPKLPSPLDVVRNSSVESSIVVSCGVDAPLRVEPTKTVPSLPLPGDRLRPLK